jgi:hypothetical protein
LTLQGLLFIVAGAALSYCGFALITNYQGFADWFDDAERRRREISRGGTVWRPDRIGPPWRFGVVVLVIGFLFLIGVITAT